MPDPKAYPIDEEESGSYIATITDDLGAMIPGSALQILRLTLYVVRQDGSTAIVNNRDHQDVLNTANVNVSDALQTLPNGKTYNLIWKIQPEDTAMVEGLVYERHFALFEWTWAQGAGKHEAILVVKNLLMVG